VEAREPAAPAARETEGAAAETAPGMETAAAEPSAPDTQALLVEANEKYLRAKAELENYRKRVQREFAEIRQYTKQATIEEFLSVYDHFQMALAHADETPNVTTLNQGLAMISAEFRRTLEALGVVFVEALGQPFDPNEHEAVAQEPSAEVPEGHVSRQWKCGFRLGERLLRPATVVVSSGPSAAADAEAEQDAEEKHAKERTD